MMIVKLSREQMDLKEHAIKFARKELNEGAKEREKRGEFSMESWKKCAEYGIHGLALPEKYGGLGMDIMSCVLTMEGLGYACKDSGLLFALNSHIWTCEMPILKFGTEKQKEKYLRLLRDGSFIGGHAITEPDSGSDAFNMRAKAEKKDDRYILNGTKIFISNAPIADILLVFAITDKTKGFGGISAFIVEKGTPGFSIGKPIDKLGLKSSPMSEVILEDCEISAENLLGPEGAGSAIFNSEMDWERSCLFATHLGAMENILEDTIRYAKERKQFGQQIGKFQSISHKIADMKVRIELSRLMLYKVVSIKAEGKRANLESSIAKLFISESYVQTCLDALQIHGAYGYTTEFDIERHLRDSLGGKIYSGSSEIQRNIIARFLGL
jgi:hypothetical protein